VLLWVVFSCSQPVPDDRAAKGESGFDDTPVAEPSNISGSFLTYEKAQIRCSQSSLDSYNHIVTCNLVEQIADGVEIKPQLIDEGLSVIWDKTLISNAGYLEIKSCDISEDLFTLTCNVKTDGKLVKVVASAKLEKDDQTKTKSAQILLPYSVGVSAGFMPLFPYGYVSEDQEQIDSASLFLLEESLEPNYDIDISKEKFVGLQKQVISDEYLEDIRGGCEIGGETYVFGSHLVYKKTVNGLEIVLGTKDVYFLPELKALNYNPLKTPVNFSKSISYCLNGEIYARSGDATVAYNPETNALRFIPSEDIGELKGLIAMPDKTGKNFIIFSPTALTQPSETVYFLFEGEVFDPEDGGTRSTTASGRISSVQPYGEKGWMILNSDNQFTQTVVPNEAGGVNLGVESLAVGDFSGSWGAVTGHNADLATFLAQDKYLVYSNVEKVISLYDTSGVDPVLTPLVGNSATLTTLYDIDVSDLNYLYAISEDTVYFGTSTSLYKYTLGSEPTLLAGTSDKTVPDEIDSRNLGLGFISDIKYNRDGEIIFIDRTKHIIFKLKRDGTIVRLAGKGGGESSPDGTPALDANLKHPQSLALAPTGEIYFTETLSHVIRKINLDGNIETLVGTLDTPGDTAFDDANGLLNFPYNIQIASNGDIYFTQIHGQSPDGNTYATGSLRKWTAATDSITTLTSMNYSSPNIDRSAGNTLSDYYGYPGKIQMVGEDKMLLSVWSYNADQNGGFLEVNLADLAVSEIAGAVTPGTLLRKDFSNPKGFVFHASGIAYLDKNNIFLANTQLSLQFLLKLDLEPSEGNNALTQIFGSLLNENISCGEGEHKGYTRKDQTSNALRMSLSNICEGGLIRNVAISNNCSAEGETSFKLAFTQSFESKLDSGSTYSHIIEAELPCPDTDSLSLRGGDK
jgi:hypothetical protein